MRIPILLASFLGTALAGMEPKVTYHFEPDGFRGDSTQLVVVVAIPQPWHIQSEAPLDSFLIPTTLKAEGTGFVFGKPVYPKSVIEDFPALGGKVALLQGEFEIKVPAKRADSKVKADALKAVKVVLRYQACDNTQCLPPREVPGTFSPAKKSKAKS